MTARTCGILVLLSAAGGAALVTILREPNPTRGHQVAPGFARDAQPGVHADALEGSRACIPIGPGTVAHVRLADRERQDHLNEQLHFCVFENGANDLIYVGTKYGMWSSGEFDLSIDGTVVFTGKVKHLVYEGTIINMGDVMVEQPRSNIGIEITRVAGWFK